MAKTNDPLATRRLGNRPKPEKVRQAEVTKGAAVKAARRQNQNDGDETSLAVIPNRGSLAPKSGRK